MSSMAGATGFGVAFGEMAAFPRGSKLHRLFKQHRGPGFLAPFARERAWWRPRTDSCSPSPPAPLSEPGGTRSSTAGRGFIRGRCPPPRLASGIATEGGDPQGFRKPPRRPGEPGPQGDAQKTSHCVWLPSCSGIGAADRPAARPPQGRCMRHRRGEDHSDGEAHEWSARSRIGTSGRRRRLRLR